MWGIVDFNTNLSGIKPTSLDAALFEDRINHGFLAQTQSLLKDALEVMTLFCN
jgi:hypothetical protein